ncbi:MAG: hypothetical protein RL120_15365 [Gammaproteobacteria bacterium]
MSLKPVVLIYDLNNTLVDQCAKILGQTGLYTTINTYNESNAHEAIRHYNRFYGLFSNRLSCIITGWNSYKKPRDQLLFKVRSEERRSPLRRPTPVVIITEDHRTDLKNMALDPMDGYVSAYLHVDDYQHGLNDVLHKIVFGERAQELNSIAYAQLRRDEEEAE